MTRKKAPPAKTAAKESAADRRKRFAEAYLLNDGNITKAALAVGFAPRSAAQQGSRLLKNDEVQQLIQQRREQVLVAAQEKVQLTTEAVLRSLAQALFFDPRKLYRKDGSMLAIHELDEDTAQALSGFEVIEHLSALPADVSLEPQPHGGGLKRYDGRKVVTSLTAKVKWLDKNTARDQAARMLGMFEKDNRQQANPLTDLLGALMKTRSAVPIVEAE
jgi:glycine/D-amino acid oxidase-like deaminating enzyme